MEGMTGKWGLLPPGAIIRFVKFPFLNILAVKTSNKSTTFWKQIAYSKKLEKSQGWVEVTLFHWVISGQKTTSWMDVEAWKRQTHKYMPADNTNNDYVPFLTTPHIKHRGFSTDISHS